eukprot:4361091-Pleurochrysis_carterae.AAC.1
MRAHDTGEADLKRTALVHAHAEMKARACLAARARVRFEEQAATSQTAPSRPQSCTSQPLALVSYPLRLATYQHMFTAAFHCLRYISASLRSCSQSVSACYECRTRAFGAAAREPAPDTAARGRAWVAPQRMLRPFTACVNRVR